MDPGEVLRDYLVGHLPALRDAWAGALREDIAFYQAIPEERLKAAAEAMLRVFVEESLPTWDLAPVVAAASDTLRTRATAGLPRDGALAISTCFRRLFLRRVEALLEAKLPGVPRLLLFVDDFCETLNEGVRKYYDDALEVAQKALRESEARYRDLVELSPDGIAVYRDGRFLYFNLVGARILGTEPAALVGTDVLSSFPPDSRDEVMARMRAVAASAELVAPIEHVLMRADGGLINVELVSAPVMFEGRPARQVVFRDVGERKRAEEAVKRAAMQEEIIQAQAATLREVSTPLIPVSDGVVVMPLVGYVDQVRADQMRQVLLSGISSTGAKVAILDVTGVPAMDASVAGALLSAVAAARLLGAEVVLTGIKPAAAQALVGLGVDFGRVVTRGTLKDGIAHALSREQR